MKRFSTIQSPSCSLTWITFSLLPPPMSTNGRSSAPTCTAAGAPSINDMTCASPRILGGEAYAASTPPNLRRCAGGGWSAASSQCWSPRSSSRSACGSWDGIITSTTRCAAERAAFAAPAPPLDGSTPANGTRVEVRGTYDRNPAHETLLRDQLHNGNAGVDVLTPVLLSDGTAVVVDRGWVATGDRRERAAGGRRRRARRGARTAPELDAESGRTFRRAPVGRARRPRPDRSRPSVSTARRVGRGAVPATTTHCERPEVARAAPARSGQPSAICDPVVRVRADPADRLADRRVAARAAGYSIAMTGFAFASSWWRYSLMP